jgi:hypothetical protein
MTIPPTLQQEHPGHGFLQGIGLKPIADAVPIVMPPGQEPSVMVGASGVHYQAKIEGAERVSISARLMPLCS